MVDIIVNYSTIIIPSCIALGIIFIAAALIFQKKLICMFEKYKTVIMYLIFGVLTTVINILSFFLLSEKVLTGFNTVIPNVIAWFVSVVFAFVTNKYFVFDTDGNMKNGFFAQLVGFFAARLISGVIDTGIVYLFVDALGFDKTIIKILSNVFVIIFNYVASKLVIFKKK